MWNLPGVCTERSFCFQTWRWRNCRFIFPYSYKSLLQSRENTSFLRGTAMCFSHGDYLPFLIIPRSYHQISAPCWASAMSAHPPLLLVCCAVQKVGMMSHTGYVYSSKLNNCWAGLRAQS